MGRGIYLMILIMLGAGMANAAEGVKASYGFRPAPKGVIVDESGQGMDAIAVLEGSEGWVDTDAGPALEFKTAQDRIELPGDVFDATQGAVRLTFRTDVVNENAQYLFRVYGSGDGLTLCVRNGQLDLRYYNRSTQGNTALKRPVKTGEWITVTVSWDFDEEPRIGLQAGETPMTIRQLPADLEIRFAEENKVVVGNEHVGGAPLLGALRSVQIFTHPIWTETQARGELKPPVAEIAFVARERVLPKTLFFSRTQPKYDLFSNTLLRRWIDRPLFFDRRTGESDKPFEIVSSPSFLKTQESLKAYGLDGLGSLLGFQPFQRTAFLEMLDALDSQDRPMVPLVMEVGAVHDVSTLERILKCFVPLAERALQSPNVLRVNGRVLVLSYGVDGGSVEAWAALREEMKKRFGDKFLFIADVTTQRPALLREFQELGGISVLTLERYRTHLREWLNVSDGIMWAGGSHTNRPDGTLDRAFYREFLVPVFHEILNEAPYRKKLLGLDAEVGYINVMTSRTVNSEEGTRRLRDNFEIAWEAQPDFVTMPEWDELNENTSVGPTLTNSLSTQRIVRSYVNRFAGKPNEPMLGDDIAVPNLVVSFRPNVKLGDRLEIEVLSIPETSSKGVIGVELSLKNSAGKIVQEFPRVNLPADTMADHVFTVPSEDLSAASVLTPSLRVTAVDGKVTQWADGLECIRLEPTWNLNYKATKMPLRDVLQPLEASFRVVDRISDGGLQVEGKISCDEPIMSVEVVQDSRELFAVDPRRELTPKPDEALIMLQWQAMRNPSLPFTGTVEVIDGELRNFVDWARPEYKRASYRLTRRDDGKVHFSSDNGVNSTNARGGFFVVGTPEKAVLSMKTNQFQADFRVKDIMDRGRLAQVFPSGLTVEVQKLELLPQLPFPLLEKEVTFNATIYPLRPDSPLQMRVVTESGKIYRSPAVAVGPEVEETTDLPIWSETHQDVRRVPISLSRIPDLRLEMSDQSGAHINIPGQKYFHALAGGVPFDMGAFAKRYLASAYPASSRQTSPKWVKEDGATCLKFNGKGNFIYLPEESLPRGSFHVEFEIKPEGQSDKPQMLCLNRGYKQGALTLMLVKGQLMGRWMNRENKNVPFETGLSLPAGEWSTVSLDYDLSRLVIEVNGESRSIPIPGGIAKNITPFIFGGYGTGEGVAWFSGYLRDLRIRHAPNQMKTEVEAARPLSVLSACKTFSQY